MSLLERKLDGKPIVGEANKLVALRNSAWWNAVGYCVKAGASVSLGGVKTRPIANVTGVVLVRAEDPSERFIRKEKISRR